MLKGGADRHLLGIGAGFGKFTPVAVVEQPQGLVGQLQCFIQPGLVERCLEQLDQAMGKKGIILQKGRYVRGAAPEAAQESAVAAPQIFQDESRGPGGTVDEVLRAADRTTPGQCRDHQAVPGGDDLFIPERMDALAAVFEEPPATLFQELFDLLLIPTFAGTELPDVDRCGEDRAAFEIAVAADIVEPAEKSPI